MKKRIGVIIISMMFAFFIMSGGYGLWQKKLIIKGTIEVVQPERVPDAEKIFIEGSQDTENNTINEQNDVGEQPSLNLEDNAGIEDPQVNIVDTKELITSIVDEDSNKEDSEKAENISKNSKEN